MNKDHILNNEDFEFIDKSLNQVSDQVGFDIIDMLDDFELPERANKKQILKPIPNPVNNSTSNHKIQADFVFEILQEIRSLVRYYKENGLSKCIYKFSYDGYTEELRNPKILLPLVKLLIEEKWKKNKIIVTISQDFKSMELNW